MSDRHFVVDIVLASLLLSVACACDAPVNTKADASPTDAVTSSGSDTDTSSRSPVTDAATSEPLDVAPDTSSDSSSDTSFDTAGAPSSYAPLYRVRAQGGWVICPRTPQMGTDLEDGTFVCVAGGPTGHRADSSTQYLCELERGEAPPIVGTCEQKPQDVAAWSPPCDEPHGHGSKERGWGEQCWAPPENFCTWGCSSSNESGVRTWSCKSDGSQCCRSTCQTCGRCGWVQVRGESECLMAGADSAKSESFCRNFFKKLPSSYKKCIRGNCSESEVQMLQEKAPCGEHVPNESLVWCPE